jgi:putative transposase
LPQLDNAVGVDLGIATFATLSTGEKEVAASREASSREHRSDFVDAPKPLKKRIGRLRRLSKNLSRKTKGSRRYEVARKRKAKLQAKLKDTRTDFLHKLSTKLIRENQAIILEDLNISGMLKNRKLSSSISDLGRTPPWAGFPT